MFDTREVPCARLDWRRCRVLWSNLQQSPRCIGHAGTQMRLWMVVANGPKHSAGTMSRIHWDAGLEVSYLIRRGISFGIWVTAMPQSSQKRRRRMDIHRECRAPTMTDNVETEHCNLRVIKETSAHDLKRCAHVWYTCEKTFYVLDLYSSWFILHLQQQLYLFYLLITKNSKVHMSSFQIWWMV